MKRKVNVTGKRQPKEFGIVNYTRGNPVRSEMIAKNHNTRLAKCKDALEKFGTAYLMAVIDEREKHAKWVSKYAMA